MLEPFEPAYLAAYRDGRLAERVEAARAELASCRACPRDCDVDRLAGETGVCHVGRHAPVASAFAHFGEEDCLRGWAGSGTIFFGSCNLRCVFCQNWDISQRPAGPELTADRLASLMLELQDQGCHNVNLVTPEHVVPQVIEAVAEAVPLGLRVPIVYNTSAYDALRSLRLLDGLVDVYMPDLKFWRPETARRLARAADYPQRAREAILEMHRQVGDLRVGPDGLARRGLIVRHLVMPGLGDETEAILGWLAREVSPDAFVNVMGQYRPEHRVGTPDRAGRVRHGEIDRRPSTDELAAAHAAARRAGLWRV
ncbi:MAG: radical SAM protein [Acidimicrobiia bacterium]|nr:radical SAM protein [Acidimicrobiia bacterium]